MRRGLVIVLTIFLFVLGVSDSRKCGTAEEMNAETLIKVLNQTGKVQRSLELKNTDLAFIARKGTPNNKGIVYTHVGIIWKNSEGWRITHLLETCGVPEPALYDEGVGNFFSAVTVYDAKILIPSEETQRKMITAIEERKIDKFLGKEYNLIVNPFSDKYQNSDQFILEAYSYVKSDEKYNTRKELIEWYTKQGFRSRKVKLGFLERTFGPTVKGNIKLDDHKGRKKNNEIETITADEVINFIKKLESDSEVYEVKEL